MTTARVLLWGRQIGAVSLDEGEPAARFQYTPAFARSGIRIAPLMMPPTESVYQFPELNPATFHRLPGLLADSLPDKFGNTLIDRWLSTQGRSPSSFDAVERLCYIGRRGMGALEFAPVSGPLRTKATKIEIAALVKLASEALSEREGFAGAFTPTKRGKALQDFLLVGTSAGGARAKAVIAWNPKTNEVRSGQVSAGEDFGYWLLKFDGISGNKDKELDDPQGFGAIEYAYYRMAQAAGITMMESRLFEENGRRHFMTKRFDRLEGGEKLHMQSLCAMAHLDFNDADTYSYEQAFMTIRNLECPTSALEEQYRRMVFNVVARNQDDHVKNIAFLMNKDGRWSLAPAFDLAYAYNPVGPWTNQHQMSLNGKRDGFTRQDFHIVAKAALLKRGRDRIILEEILSAVKRWPEFAQEAGIPARDTDRIATIHRLSFLES